MRIIVKYCKSIIKSNKGFSVGLLLLFMALTFSVCSLQTVTPSMRASVDKFNNNYHAPDAWFVTKPVADIKNLDLEDIDNIESTEPGLVCDVKCVTDRDDVFSLRAFSIQEEGFREYYKSETAEVPDGMPRVWMTRYFAKNNNIKAGDILKIKSGKEYKEFFVEAIVSLPEAIVCVRDDISWYGYSDFCYIYMDKAELESVFAGSQQHFSTKSYAQAAGELEFMKDMPLQRDVSNFLSFRFKEGLTEKERQDTFDEIRSSLKDIEESGELFETSIMNKEFQDGIDRTQKICDVLPGLIYIIGILFSYLFIVQVINNQRKNIGLLKALGYSNAAVLRVFLSYSILICFLGMLLSLPFSAASISFIFEVVKERYSLPEMIFSVDITMIAGKLLCMPAVAVLACLFETRSITKVDPAEAYGDMADISTKPVPGWLARLKTSSILKTQLVSLHRNRKSLWMSAFALAGSIALLFFAFAYYISTNMQEPAVFGDNGRYQYDYIVNQEPGSDFRNSALSVLGVANAEHVTAFKDDIRSEHAEFKDVLINAIDDDGDLIVPRDRGGDRVCHGDGIILDDYLARQLNVKTGDTVTVGDMDLTVNGIAFEVKNCIQYISYDTASAMGKGDPNQVVIKTDGSKAESDIKKELTDLPGYLSTITLENQHKDLINAIGLTKTIVYITVACSVLLSVIIVFNMVILSVNKRKREFAVMNSLGVPMKKMFVISAVENLARYFASLIIGLPAGILLPILFFDSFSSITTNFPVVYLTEISVICAVISIGYAASGVLITLKKIRDIDPAIVLNTRE